MTFGSRLLAWDHRLTFFLYRSDSPTAYQHLLYLVGTYLIYLLPLMLLVFFFSARTRVESAKIFVMTVITWLVFNKFFGNWLYSHYGFRDRPFATHGVTELLFEQPQKAFPSDHAAVLMFVTLALFYYGHKRWGWLFAAVTLLAGLARIALGFHWVGDTLGGWAMGAISFGLLVCLDPYLQKIGDWFFGLFNGIPKNGNKTNP